VGITLILFLCAVTAVIFLCGDNIDIIQMEGELERFNKQNTQLELNIDELRQKLKATEKEMFMERQRVGALKHVTLNWFIIPLRFLSAM